MPVAYRIALLRRLRKFRSAACDWGFNEALKSLLDQLWRLKEVGIVVPLLVSQPSSINGLPPANEPQLKTPASVRVVVASEGHMNASRINLSAAGGEISADDGAVSARI